MVRQKSPHSQSTTQDLRQVREITQRWPVTLSNLNPLASEGEMTSIKAGCHPELVEGSRAEALPAMLRQAQHDPCLIMSWVACRRVARRGLPTMLRQALSMTPIFNNVMGSDSEASSSVL